MSLCLHELINLILCCSAVVCPMVPSLVEVYNKHAFVTKLLATSSRLELKDYTADSTVKPQSFLAGWGMFTTLLKYDCY